MSEKSREGAGVGRLLFELRDIVEKQEKTISKKNLEIDQLNETIGKKNTEIEQLVSQVKQLENDKKELYLRITELESLLLNDSSHGQDSEEAHEFSDTGELGRKARLTHTVSVDLPNFRRARPQLKREKTLSQRRDGERIVKRSRALTNPYELSADLHSKQVEILERKYGGRLVANQAARLIQQAYRQYAMNRNFERLRHSKSKNRMSRRFAPTPSAPGSWELYATSVHPTTGGVKDQVSLGEIVSITKNIESLSGAGAGPGGKALPDQQDSPSSGPATPLKGGKATLQELPLEGSPGTVADTSTVPGSRGGSDDEGGARGKRASSTVIVIHLKDSGQGASPLPGGSPQEAEGFQRGVAKMVSLPDSPHSPGSESSTPTSTPTPTRTRLAYGGDQSPLADIGLQSPPVRGGRPGPQGSPGGGAVPSVVIASPEGTTTTMSSSAESLPTTADAFFPGVHTFIDEDGDEDLAPPARVEQSPQSPDDGPPSPPPPPPGPLDRASSEDSGTQKAFDSSSECSSSDLSLPGGVPPPGFSRAMVNGVGGPRAGGVGAGLQLDKSESSDSLGSLSLASVNSILSGSDSINFGESISTSLLEAMHGRRQQLSAFSIPMTEQRRRRYRIGLNLFNKKPEKGVRFLIENKFLEETPSVVASFLLNRKGLSKQMIGEYLGNLQKEFNMEVLDCFVDQMDFSDIPIDEALRNFQSTYKMPGEAQKIERLMEAFGQRYCMCNEQLVSQFMNPDTIFILAFAIIMLNTDLHNPNVKSERRMRLEDFIKNLRGIDKGKDIDRTLLVGIYGRVKSNEFKPGADHVTQVRKLEQCIVGTRPMLAESHRRLVCYCRLFEVYDPTKKDKPHQREVFLFNDILVVTKVFSRKKSGIVYNYKKSFPLHGMTVLLFETPYYQYGIRLTTIVDQKILITFTSQSEDDRNKFVADLRESIAEMNEMEDIRIGAELEKQKLMKRACGSTGDSGVGLDTDSMASSSNLTDSMDSLSIQLPGDGNTIKRSALSNSLLNINEVVIDTKERRNSAGSLDGLAVPRVRRSLTAFGKKAARAQLSSFFNIRKSSRSNAPTKSGPIKATESSA